MNKKNYNKLLKIFFKRDPLKLQSSSKDEYSSEAARILGLVDFFGGIDNLSKEKFLNIVYSGFIEHFCTLLDMDGNISICTMAQTRKIIGKKSDYQSVSDEAFQSLGGNISSTMN
jgi:hypothetical protein